MGCTTMTNEERDIISRFVARYGGSQQINSWGSVPSTQAPAPLPPVDPEADQLIAQLFTQYPEARYRITQAAFVHEAALGEAQHRIEQLQWQLQQLQQQMQQQAQQPGQAPRGILGGLFGGGSHPVAAPLPPPIPPQYGQYAPQPQMFQQAGSQGSGFLGSALHTAAGVAGGVVLGNLFMDLLGGRQGFGGGGFGGAGFGGFGGGFGGGVPVETVTNNYYGGDQGSAAAAGSDPWGGAGTQIDNSGDADWSNQDNSGDQNSGDAGGDTGGDTGGDSGGGDWGN